MSEKKTVSAGSIIVGISIILGIIVGVFILEDRIEKIVTTKLKDPEILNEIASLVRPSLTFDHKGTIRTDSGAGQLIEKIIVEMDKAEPSEIIISPKNHLNTPPVLECINYNFDITSEQVNKSDWLFVLSSPDYLVLESSPKMKEWIFRLEIIR